MHNIYLYICNYLYYKFLLVIFLLIYLSIQLDNQILTVNILTITKQVIKPVSHRMM